MNRSLLIFSLIVAFVLPTSASAISVINPGDLVAADFWSYIEATNSALTRIEDRGASATSVELLNPSINGVPVTGNLTANNATAAAGPTTTVNANLNYSDIAAFDTTIALRSLVTFDLAAFGISSQASVRINGSGIGGVTGNIFGQFGQASATTFGYITVYETTASGGFGSIVGSWNIPSSFTDTIIDDVITLNTAELYKVVVRSEANVRLFNIDAFNISAYMIVDPVFTSETTGVEVFVSPGASPVPVPGAMWLFGSGLLGLVGIARSRKAA